MNMPSDPSSQASPAHNFLTPLAEQAMRPLSTYNRRGRGTSVVLKLTTISH